MSKTLRSPRHLALIAALRDARKEAGMTQDQLATALGKPQSFIAKIEGAERRLDVIEFVSIVEVLSADAPGILKTLHMTAQT